LTTGGSVDVATQEQLEGRQRVLVVDDEPTVREVATAYLERDGYLVDTAADGQSAASLLGRRPDLVVLDITLPGVDGLTLLNSIRRSTDTPVILLTSRTDEVDRVLGLELGADDYVTKPFSPRELAARVRSVLRRANPRTPATLEFDGLEIDTGAREVRVAGRTVPFRHREFDLLAFLAASPRQVFSRSELLHHVWHSSDQYCDVSTVTVHVRRVREKIERDAMEPRYIVTVRGAGYRFEP
jgi:DNA-binding response OmpR family regulator